MFFSPSDIAVYISLFLSLFFEVFLFITYFERKREVSNTELCTTDYKSVTIIVPCYNEENTVSKTIHSLLELDYPKNKLKLIIVDDGSTDNTQEVLKSFEKNTQIEIYRKENGGKFRALNFALDRTKSELVGCLDADSFVEPDALKKIVAKFIDEETMAVTPAVKVYKPKKFLQSIQNIEYGWGIFFRKMLSLLGAIYVTPGPFSIFRTQVFRKLGGYKHAHFTEDFEIALRMQKNHMKIVNVHDASVFTQTPETLKTLYKQRLRWTYGFLNNVIDYRSLFFNRKYGNVGIFILPMATLSIITALYFTLRSLWQVGIKISNLIEKFSVVGIDTPKLTFTWFSMNTSPIFFITLAVISLYVFILLLSKKLAFGKFRPSFDLLLFLIVYPLIAPLWLGSALFNTIFIQNITWK